MKGVINTTFEKMITKQDLTLFQCIVPSKPSSFIVILSVRNPQQGRWRGDIDLRKECESLKRSYPDQKTGLISRHWPSRRFDYHSQPSRPIRLHRVLNDETGRARLSILSVPFRCPNRIAQVGPDRLVPIG